MQVAVILAAVMPGFVYQVSRRRVAGPDPDEREFGVRILRAIAASAMLASLYAVVLGPRVVTYVRDPEAALEDIQVLGLAYLLTVVVVPWIAARVVFYVTTADWFTTARSRFLTTFRLLRPWDPTPSAWDFIFATVEPGWVRIRLQDGSWVGGWFAEKSFASAFPDPQELYIEVGYVLSPEGTFTGEVSAPGGMFVRCQDAVAVDFIPADAGH